MNKDNGFHCVVLGHTVRVKLWIHYFIGDTKGNNKWLGQYPGNREGVRHPYRDCKCQFQDLRNPNPNCIYLTMEDINYAKKREQDNEDAGIEYYRSVSMYDIRNALTEKSLPLSDNIHGPYKMMPPELLLTSGSGLIMYMFESLRDQVGDGNNRDLIDRQHILISNLIKRQSERDFPIGSMRNGLIDGTKCQSSEGKRNLFRLLCIAHTTNGSCVIKISLKFSDMKLKHYIEFLKLYLCMEECFHDLNNKLELISAQTQIAKVLESLKHFIFFQEIHTPMDTIFKRCMELLKCRSI
jgi:hypothetical protein